VLITKQRHKEKEKEYNKLFLLLHSNVTKEKNDMANLPSWLVEARENTLKTQVFH